MPDNHELREKRLIKKKANDNDIEEDSDEEMLQLLQRQVKRRFALWQSFLFALPNI